MKTNDFPATLSDLRPMTHAITSELNRRKLGEATQRELRAHGLAHRVMAAAMNRLDGRNGFVRLDFSGLVYEDGYDSVPIEVYTN